MFDSCLNSDEVTEKEIEVDGEPASITLIDTWDSEVSFFYKMNQRRDFTCLCVSILSPVCAFQTDSECMYERYMQTGDAYLLLYSITDRASYLRASELRITLRRFRPAQNTPIILVGNKCDLVRRREVSVSGKEA